ncbi:MAG TPA: TfoX/Sxy family protein [Chloroflexota bacterium]|nr:TfoX/Sxy family protein [Chloroflexota bacterium]
MTSQPADTPDAHYAAIVAALTANPEVTHLEDAVPGKKLFGSTELKVKGKIFAMLNKGRLVVKIPRARVDALIAAGQGERFDPRHDGRLMKEWIVIEPTAREEWLPLAREAMEFVASKS